MTNFEETLSGLEQVLLTQMNEVQQTKRTINGICKILGIDPRYADADETLKKSAQSVRSDQYFGQPLATNVRHILESRRLADLGPASVNEIYEKLKEGGHELNKNEANAKRSLRISLSKNTTFFKLPGGGYGLREWYPNAKPAKEEPEQSNVEDGQKEGESKPESAF